MNTLSVIAFDLSSSCIGVTTATVIDGYVTQVKVADIVPRKFTGLDYGYKTKTPKKIGAGYSAFLKEDEFHITKAEASRRQSDFKVFKHRDLLLDIGKQVSDYISSLDLDLVMIERNMTFNGVLTTKILAEIAGQIHYLAASNAIEFESRSVHTVRKLIRKAIPLSPADRVQKDGSVALETKAEIKARLKKVYGHLVDFDTMSEDGSDSLAVFHSKAIEEKWNIIQHTHETV